MEPAKYLFMSKNNVIVVNPRSGGAGHHSPRLGQDLANQLRALGHDSTQVQFPTSHQDSAWPQRLHAALDEEVRAVYALGGDGTVLAMAREMLGRNVPLGIIPLGTANLLARDLGIPLKLEAAIDALAPGRVERIDVARCNELPFLCAAMFGMPTDLGRAREAARSIGAWRMLPRMIRKLVWLLKRYPFYPIRLQLDDRAESLSTRVMIVSNNAVDPHSYGINPVRPSLTDGRLGVYGVREGPLYELPRLALTLLNGTWQQEPRMFYDICEHARIFTKKPMRTTALLDGERELLQTPLRFDILPKALPVLLPNSH
ncbi:MAG TPA: hypothetical protein DDY14_09125 [Chromatiaceae bacterium]|jgi:diacylglycerol kinase family enzyme|nr:MAG: hypothetical protein N838_17595 [Thiohalocapsa sp. PB-PSB1]HBG95465.1 hypothetical protein [Chromatiaceae bacterium]HCS89678.1 hypothetical protein [Chromatiaceae bacterium]